MRVGNLEKHRSSDGFGTIVDIDGMRYKLKIVLVMWCDQRGVTYEPVNELVVIS